MQWTCHKCDTTIIGYRPEHCTICHETFNGTHVGDMHRVGDHGVKTGPMVAGASLWTRWRLRV